ncbi:MAG: 30S ribosomal protein S6 [Candidatus Villigracilaceae bacterium]
MRKYELVVLIQPDLDEAAFVAALEKISGWITESGGSVDKVERWSQRKLAYPIRKLLQAQYVLFNLTLAPAATADLERNLRFLEPVMRHLLVLV